MLSNWLKAFRGNSRRSWIFSSTFLLLNGTITIFYIDFGSHSLFEDLTIGIALFLGYLITFPVITKGFSIKGFGIFKILKGKK